ncbi:hypothetical protein [Prosthecomicrobium sp. N25]|uniref:hypothetical protein n=1 Tax=Prosthecomicrobium sp. N25 TaxID=3129254 RepID=UPI0030787833
MLDRRAHRSKRLAHGAATSAVLVLIACASALAAEWPSTRGIRTDPKVELPLDPDAGPAQKPLRPIAPVRLATRGDDRQALAGLAARTAPFEVVGASTRPDLLWDPQDRTVRQGEEVVGTDVAAADLPDVIDRTALVRLVTELSGRSPQAIRLQPEGRVRRAGERIQIVVPGVANRNLAVFSVSGNGTVALLYPTRRDPPAVAGQDAVFTVEVGPPFGAEQIFAVSRGLSLADFVTTLRRLNGRKGAGQILAQLDALPAIDLQVGTAAIATQP